jgi:sec-independent protein translocase protein TatC
MTAASQQSTPPSRRDDEKNLTLIEHLRELRTRLMICAGAMIVGGTVALVFFTTWVLKWLKEPAEKRIPDFELVFTKPLEYWTTYFNVSLQLAIAMAMPIILWQLFAFVGPAMTRSEKRWIYPIVLGGSTMFILGALFAYYIEMPPALGFLLSAPGGVAQPLISVQSYYAFATRLMLVTGLVFETPLVVMGLAKIGIVTSRQLLHWWRFAIVGAFIASAIVTPSIDPITQSLVAGPMIVLYFFGILLAKMVESSPLIARQ